MLHNPSRSPIQLRAELIGSKICTGLDITAHGHAPVLRLCQLLVDAGHDPTLPLEASRGFTLCLRVRSIGEGARLRIATHGVGFERVPECTAGPPASKIDEPVPESPRALRKAVQASRGGAS